MANQCRTAVEWLIILTLGMMVALVFGNVVLRYGFNSGLDISEELSRFLFVWLTFAGAALVLKEGGHLGVTGLLDALPPRGRLVCHVLSNAIGAAACGLLAVGACRETITGMGNLAPVTDLPLGVVYLSAALGASFMTLVFLQALWRAATGKAAVDDAAAGAAGAADMAEKQS